MAMLGLVAMLEIMANVLASSQSLHHCARRDQMVISTRCHLEDGVFQAGSICTLAQYVLFANSALGHDV